MYLYFIAFLSGITPVISRIINARFSEKTDKNYGVFFNFAAGLLVSICLMLVLTGLPVLPTPVISWRQPHLYLGGTIGVLVVWLANYITPKMPAFYMSLLTFAGQLWAGILLDYIIFDLFSVKRSIGGILICIGLWYNLRLDRRNNISATL